MSFLSQVAVNSALVLYGIRRHVLIWSVTLSFVYSLGINLHLKRDDSIDSGIQNWSIPGIKNCILQY